MELGRGERACCEPGSVGAAPAEGSLLWTFLRHSVNRGSRVLKCYWKHLDKLLSDKHMAARAYIASLSHTH